MWGCWAKNETLQTQMFQVRCEKMKGLQLWAPQYGQMLGEDAWPTAMKIEKYYQNVICYSINALQLNFEYYRVASACDDGRKY